MKARKIISAALALASAAVLTTSLAGCGARTIPKIDYDSLMKNIENPEDYIYPEQIEIKIPVYNRAQADLPDVTNNYWTKYVQREFGDKHNIKVTYISISRGSAVTQFNQRLAGKVANMPDIIFDYDYPMAVNFAKMGVYRELTNELVEYFAPDYYKHTESLNGDPDDSNSKDYTKLNGKKIFLLGTRPQAYNFVTLVRKDWIDKAKKAGLIDFDEPANEEDYEKMYLAFKELKPGGSKTVPQNASLGGTNYGSYRYREYPLPEEENALYSDISVAPLTWKPAHDALKRENELYHKGIMSQDWYLDSDGKTAQERFIAGQAGTFGCYLTKSPDYIAQLKENVPDAEVTIFRTYTDPLFHDPETGEEIPVPNRSYYPYGLISGINQYCAHPEAVLMYYEWMYDNLITMQNGIEGVTYNMEEVEGVEYLKGVKAEIPVAVSGYSGEERLNYNSNKDMWCIVIEGTYAQGNENVTEEQAGVLAQEKMYAPSGYEWMIERMYENWLKTRDYDYTDYAFASSLDSMSQYSGILKEYWLKARTELVTCDPDQFESKYEKFCSEYLNLGYQAVLDEKKQLYEQEKAERESVSEGAEVPETAADE